MKFANDSVQSRRTLRFLSVRERDCDIIKLNGVDGNGGQFLSCSDEYRFCLFAHLVEFCFEASFC